MMRVRRETMIVGLRRLCRVRGGILILIILVAVCILYELYEVLEMQREMFNIKLTVEGDESLYLVDTPGCLIPNMKTWSPAALVYVYDVPPVDCGKPPLVESNDTHLRVVTEALPHYGVADPRRLSCCFRPMWRNVPNATVNLKGHVNNKTLHDEVCYDKDIRYSPSCYPIFDTAESRHELVRIECGLFNGVDLDPLYTDYHTFFPRPPEVKGPADTSKQPDVNVLFLGVDSLSRLNMIRKLPRTFAYLTQDLQAIPMYGYNKVGLNTFPNLVPLLSGSTYEELEKHACWPKYHAHFDHCPWIWKRFSSRGYSTAYMEDSPKMSTFSYLKSSFIFQPTDYYGTTLYEAAVKDKYIKDYCMGPRNQIQVLLNYTYKYLRAMKRFGRKFFTFSWSVALSHDDVNDIQSADALYFDLLRNINTQGILNETILFFISDHGLRFGDFLKTKQAQLEGFLPTLFLVIPEWFQKKFPTAIKNVHINKQRLVTTLDIHHTLLDILNQSSLEPQVIKKRTRGETFKYPVSIFLPISENRTCRDAKIPDEFCACHHLQQASVGDPVVNKVASFVVSCINRLVQNYSDCVTHTLKKVHLAESGPPLNRVENGGGNVVEYQVSMYTRPANALYMALVLHFTKDNTFQLVGEVSRLNSYGDQPHCMPVYTLRPYCFCRDSKD